MAHEPGIANVFTGMTPRELQRDAVDAIKRHAVVMARHSPRAQAHILTEYLWAEEGTESTVLQHSAAGEVTPIWLARLIRHQLDDERRHARLLRDRLAELGREPTRPPAIARAKLWWLERACMAYVAAFAAGPIVVWLAIAAQFEATGVRVLARHLAVLDASDPTSAVVRSILGDERRHARSCAASLERLIAEPERATLAELRDRIATIDRAFGVTLAVGYWLWIARLALGERVAQAVRA